MRVALDATYTVDPEPSGVARYSRRLIQALAAADAEMEITLAARPRRFLAVRREFPGPRFRHCLLQEPLNLGLPARVDVFHGLNQRLPRYRFRRQVVTIHDVFALSSERYSSANFRRRFSALIRDAVRRADALIAVSDYTRRQLALHLGVDPLRVAVVHHGVDLPPVGTEFWRALANIRVLPDGTSLETPFLLTVGAVQVRKNTLAAVRALEKLPLPVRLVIAGGIGHGGDEVIAYIRAHNLNGRALVLGYVDGVTKQALYRRAAALVFPSLEEGFGLPVLEAMAYGLPVVASQVGALPEIAGDAALLVDPLDVEALAEACRRVLDDAALAEDLRARGRARAAAFTWEKAAQETLRVYEEA